MKKLVRGLITAIYAVCWCGLFPIMLLVTALVSVCFWCYPDEKRSYWEILKDLMFTQSLDPPNRLWK